MSRSPISLSLSLSLSLVVVTLCSSALAEPRMHDGVYFQGALGLGYLSASSRGASSAQSSRGTAAAESLLVGGTLLPGLVLGGGLVGAIALAPSGQLTAGQPSDPSFPRDPSASLALVGGFADYYLQPRAGFHLQGMLGFATLSARQSDDPIAKNPHGIGFSLGVGQELWVGDEWSIGLLGRFVYAAPRYRELSYPTYAPGLLVSFTCH